MRKVLIILGMLALCGLGAAGCGSAGSTSSSGTTASGGEGGGESSAGSSKLVETAKTELASELKGTDRPLPTAGPPAQTGKKVFAIPCSSEAPGCAHPVESFQKAATKLGWDVTVANGKGTPEGYAAAISAAIAAKADGILLVGIDCSEAKSSLERAHQAGIIVYNVYGVDCNDPAVNSGPALFDGEIQYGKYGNNISFNAQGWKAVANYIIAETNGEAEVIMLEQKQPLVTDVYAQDLRKELEKCTGCKIITLPVTLADLTESTLASKVSAALTANPNANVVSGAYDAQVELGVAQAVEAARAQGRELILTSFGGKGYQQIREGLVNMLAATIPQEWTGWAAADGMNRAFAGEPQVDEGIGVQAITKENVPSSGEEYDGNPSSSDYPEVYEKIWSGK